MLRKLLGLAVLFVLVFAVTLTTSAQSNGDVVCSGSPPTHLVGVTDAQVARSFSSLRDGVASFNILRVLPHGAQVTVLDGPVCDSDNGILTWWQVDYKGQVGWVSEGQVHSIWGDNLYWVEPVGTTPPPTTPPPATCDASPAPRLDGETEGEVAQVFSSLRTGIGSANVIRIIPGGAHFDILDGPVCAGPHYWYQVTYDGDTGWVTEGYQSTYWLEPVDLD